MSEVLERVARALCRHDGHPENAIMDGKPLWQDYVPEARVAIEAMRYPTEAMLAAGGQEDSEGGDIGNQHRIWGAMVVSALNEQHEKEG